MPDGVLGDCVAYNSEIQALDATEVRLPFKDHPPRDRLTSLTADSAITADAVDSSAAIIPYPRKPLPSPFAIGGASKRAFDVVCTLTLILLAAPLFLFVALVALLAGDGALFFSHKRVGFRGQPFGCLKFRTMVANGDKMLAEYLQSNPEAAEEWARDRKLRNDPRITPMGAFLRQTSLDELPQLFNVLRGEMSLVGPRPVTEEELSRYGDRQAAYLSARPGLTGLWQVSGRNSTTYERRTELDAEYVARWSLARDIAIMLRTVPAMLGSSKGL